MNLKEEIQEVNKSIAALQTKLLFLKSSCTHSFKEKDKVQDGWLVCTICGKGFGWYCPDNPNRDLPECDYRQEDGTYDDDCCRYCGHPDERK